MTEKNYEFDFFEVEIVEELQRFHHYDKEKALESVLEYKPILDRMGRYFNVDVFAKGVHEAVQNKVPLEQWLEHIEWCEKVHHIPILISK